MAMPLEPAQLVVSPSAEAIQWQLTHVLTHAPGDRVRFARDAKGAIYCVTCQERAAKDQSA